MAKLLALFILVPLLDVILLTRLGEAIGGWNTVGLVVLTGMLGAWLTKLEGGRAWREWQDSLARGRLPEEGVVGGVLLLLGSALLITPGVITDCVGLLLLIPWSRRFIAKHLRPRLMARFNARQADAPARQGEAARFERNPFETWRQPVYNQAGSASGRGAPVEPEQEPIIRRRRAPKPTPPPAGATIRKPPRAIIDADFEVE